MARGAKVETSALAVSSEAFSVLGVEAQLGRVLDARHDQLVASDSLARLVASVLFGVMAADPLTYAIAAFLLMPPHVTSPHTARHSRGSDARPAIRVASFLAWVETLVSAY